jgi:glyoxylase-like metal-dependent hydrolase (beta-lactamase superfamily II)
MLLETGPASSAREVLEAAGLLGIKHGQLKYIAVTHIHLDHAGGLGVLAKHFTKAGLVIHHKGARHMIDPSRLIAGASAVWGEERMKHYGDTIPVPEQRVVYAGEGDAIDLGDRKIEIWETPGHARSHLGFYDAKTNGLFCGDMVGVYFPHLSQMLGRPVVFPETMAPDYNADLMFKSLLRLAASRVEQLYFSHYGVARPPRLLIETVLGLLTVFMEMGRRCNGQNDAGRGSSRQDNINKLTVEIERYIRKGLLGDGQIPDDAGKIIKEEWQFLAGRNMIRLSAEGILHHLFLG